MHRVFFVPLLLLAPLCAQISTPPRVGVGVTQKRLTLPEALDLALRHNVEIEIERAGTAIAQEAIKAAEGAFDPVLRWRPSLESRNTPTSSVLLGSDGKLAERFHSQNFQYLHKLPWHGSSFHANFDNSRQSTNNPFVALNPFVTSQLSIGFTQPLFRNRLLDRERAEIRVRSKQRDISEVDFELKVVDVVSRVEQAYWDLVAARQDYQVQADTVNWAREQVARNQRMIESGSLAPVERAAAEAELERRVDTWYASVGRVTEVENALKALLTADRADPLWGDEIIPVQERIAEPPALDDVRGAVSRAIENRPELRHVGLRAEANDIEKRLNADQVKPQVNLVASYANMGLAGRVEAGENPFSSSNQLLFERLNTLSARAGLAPVSPPSFGGAPMGLVGGYGSALSNVFGGNFQTVQVGLSVDWNTRNRTAEANLAQTAIAERRLRHERTRIEQIVEVQVRNAMQAIQTARQRIAAAEASARASQEKLESETRLFQSGESTNFLVLTRQNEYSDSRRRVVVATLDFHKAVARLEQALGTTLASHQLSIGP